jgi:hypothetical protein
VNCGGIWAGGRGKSEIVNPIQCCGAVAPPGKQRPTRPAPESIDSHSGADSLIAASPTSFSHQQQQQPCVRPLPGHREAGGQEHAPPRRGERPRGRGRRAACRCRGRASGWLGRVALAPRPAAVRGTETGRSGAARASERAERSERAGTPARKRVCAAQGSGNGLRRRAYAKTLPLRQEDRDTHTRAWTRRLGRRAASQAADVSTHCQCGGTVGQWSDAACLQGRVAVVGSWPHQR